MAAKMAFPDRTVIACMGDGAMQMNRHQRHDHDRQILEQWSNPTLIVLVLNTATSTRWTWEERNPARRRQDRITQSIPDFPYCQNTPS